MGVSFKVARKGRRWCAPLPAPASASASEAGGGDGNAAGQGDEDETSACSVRVDVPADGLADCSVPSNCPQSKVSFQDLSSSFSLNLFPQGYSIGQPSEGMFSLLLQDPRYLHPYDRASEALFSAIECGWLPGDILDGIPCHFVNGTILCEVWDFRNCLLNLDTVDPSGDGFPTFQRVYLKISMENVIKDMALISDDSWTYNARLQAEAQILKALQPVLSLNPNPTIDKLNNAQVNKFDLGIKCKRAKRKSHNPVMINLNAIHLLKEQEKKIVGSAENTRVQLHHADDDNAALCVPHTTSDGMSDVQHSCIVELEPCRENINPKVNCSAGMSSFLLPTPGMCCSSDGRKTCVKPVPRKRVRLKAPINSQPSKKKSNQEMVQSVTHQLVASAEHTNLPPQQIEICKKAPVLRQLEIEQKHSQRVASKQKADSMKRIASTVKVKGEKPNECGQWQRPHVEKNKGGCSPILNTRKFKLHEPPSLVDCHLHSQEQNIISDLSIDKCHGKENSSKKRKFSHDSTTSVEHPSQTPALLNSKNISQSSRVSHGVLLKENSRSTTLLANVSSLQGNGTILLAQSKSDNSPKVSLLTVDDKFCLASIDVSKMGSSSSELSSEIKGDHDLLKHFLMIQMVTERYGLKKTVHTTKNVIERKPLSHSPHKINDIFDFASPGENKISMNEPCLSEHHYGFDNSIIQRRILTYAFRNKCSYSADLKRKLVLCELGGPDVHKVEAQIVSGDESPTHFAFLPNCHRADMFASQFTSLMNRDGYVLLEDKVQPFAVSNVSTSKTDEVITCRVPLSPSPCSTIEIGVADGIGPYYQNYSINYQQPPHENTLSSDQQLALSTLLEPQQAGIVASINFILKQYSQMQMPLLYDGMNYMSVSRMHPGSQILSRPIDLPNFQFLQKEHHQYIRQAVLQGQLISLEAMRNAMITEELRSVLRNVVQISNDVGQISSDVDQTMSFRSSAQQSPNAEVCESKVVALDELRQKSLHVKRIAGSITMRTAEEVATNVRGDRYPISLEGSNHSTEQANLASESLSYLPKVPSIDFDPKKVQASEETEADTNAVASTKTETQAKYS